MRRSWLYLARRSERLREPVLICPALVDSDVCNGRILGFTRAMADDRGVTVVLSQFHRIEGLSQRTNLIDFHQDGITDPSLIPR